MGSSRGVPSSALLALALGPDAPPGLPRFEVTGFEVSEDDGEIVVVLRFRLPAGDGPALADTSPWQALRLLTPREQVVAELVAGGLPNGAIARRLGLSVRTVTSHLDHVYARLGIHSRASLAALVTELRLAGPAVADRRPAPPETATPGGRLSV
ncbi:helix-turn-helix transcriptional regulator [Georgenia sp. M64]|uniref:response regulator transcription factor n=1 Tax=Georgenia sp. M64 TaxID=3120520 RepID=UPI0030E01704